MKEVLGFDPFSLTAGFDDIETFCNAAETISTNRGTDTTPETGASDYAGQGLGIAETAYMLIPYERLVTLGVAAAINRNTSASSKGSRIDTGNGIEINRKTSTAIEDLLKELQSLLREVSITNDAGDSLENYVATALSEWIIPPSIDRIITSIKAATGATGQPDQQAITDLQTVVPGIARQAGQATRLFNNVEAQSLLAITRTAGEMESRFGMIIARAVQIRREMKLRTRIAEWTGLSEPVAGELLGWRLPVDPTGATGNPRCAVDT
ncbi:MAG: hypothetical protein IPG76_00325 [Acidobacteria bacterium]|nr:hypothetical protein [Acidobacteriota bacterium]